jgi:transposase-like protein
MLPEQVGTEQRLLWSRNTLTTNSLDVRARAARLVLDHEDARLSQCATIMSIAAKTGCVPQTLHECIKKAEVDSGRERVRTTDSGGTVSPLERENRPLR